MNKFNNYGFCDFPEVFWSRKVDIMRQRKLISFDSALKKLPGNKANFDIPEGFFREHFSRPVKSCTI
jgi:hypothetical protein